MSVSAAASSSRVPLISSTPTAKRPRGRPRKDANVSLASTAAPSPSSRYAEVSSSTIQKRPRGRPRKDARDTSLASTIASATPTAGKKRRVTRPPSMTVGSRRHSSIAADSSNVSESSLVRDTSLAVQGKGKAKQRPSSTSHRTTAAHRTASGPLPGISRADSSRGSIPASLHSRTASHSRSRSDAAHRPPSANTGNESDVSLVDGVSDEDSEASESDEQSEDDASGLSSEAENLDQGRAIRSKKRKGWPSEKERMRKWRKLSVEERECVTSEGGLIWRTAIPLLNSMPKNVRSMVADSLTRVLNRIDAKLETGSVPPLARVPTGQGTRRELASTMLAWRLEEEGALLRAEATNLTATITDSTNLGMNAEITELEHMLLPEAEQIIELSKTLETQSGELEKAKAQVSRLKKERKTIKSKDSVDFPGNLEAHDLLTITDQNFELDPALSCYLRSHQRS